MERRNHKTEKIILIALFAAYLIVLLKITVFRNSSSEFRSVNTIPFSTIMAYLQSIASGNIIIGISNILGNLIIFFPLGFILASLFPKMQKWTRILILSFLCSLAIEGVQYLLSSGASDIDDIILNTLGGIGGYVVYLLSSRILKSQKHTILISALMIAITCIGLPVGSSHTEFIQGDIKEIDSDSIVAVSRSRSRSKDLNTSITIDGMDQFQVKFSENCIITLIETQENGIIINEKTITKEDIKLDDMILLYKFMVMEQGIYMAEEVEIRRNK